MLATWCPRKTNWPDSLTVDEAWRYGVTSTQPIPCGADYVEHTFVTADLNCDKCCLNHALPHIMIGDIDYLKMICYGSHYVQFEFILSFVYLVPHMSHNEQMMSVKRASSSKGQLPFLQVITYKTSPYLECTRKLLVYSILVITMR